MTNLTMLQKGLIFALVLILMGLTFPFFLGLVMFLVVVLG